MAEGEIFRELMREEGDVADMFEKNRETCGKLLTHFFLVGESFARAKGAKLEDVNISKQEMTNDGEYIFFALEVSEEAIERERRGGLLGPDGLPIGMSV